jgi:hypothetical protein
MTVRQRVLRWTTLPLIVVVSTLGLSAFAASPALAAGLTVTTTSPLQAGTVGAPTHLPP